MTDDGHRSRRRWQNDYTARGLTWDKVIDGRGVLGALRRHGLLPLPPGEGRGEGVSLRPPFRVLEIGPGYGRVYRAVRDAGIACDWTGLDLNLSSTDDLRRELPAATWVTGDCEQTLPGGPYDLVISTLTFKHLYPDFSRGAANARAVLVPDGVLAFDVPENATPDAGGWEPETDCWTRPYTRQEITAILTAAGYRTIEFGHVDHTPAHRRLLVLARP